MEPLNPSRPFACTECSRAFTRSENLSRHQKTHHSGPDAPSFQCPNPNCSAQFSRRDVCKRHFDSCSEGRGVQWSKRVKTTNAAQAVRPDSSSDAPIVIDDSNPGSSTPEDQGPCTEYEHGFFLPLETINQHVDSYFNKFHPALPFLHRSSIFTASTSPLMLKMVAAIGCLYSEPRNEAAQTLSLKLWHSGCSELENFVSWDSQKFGTVWVVQSWLLCIVYGTFSSDEKLVSKSRHMYRFITDAIRDLGLLHQKSAIPSAAVWSDLNVTLPRTASEIRNLWLEFVSQETLKLCLYVFNYLDYHLFVSCNIRPTISSIEFEWELPAPSRLWEAQKASTWWNIAEQINSARNPFMDLLQVDRQTRSLLVATQALLSNSATPTTMSALAESPFAILCVATNLESLVRDLTLSYYQLPTNLPDPSPFHVLTQSQNAQVACALRLIWSVMEDGPCKSCSRDCKSLWHAVRVSCLSTKISLCKPDNLLVGGIVESSPIAGLVTAAHLSLGNFVNTRRAGLTRQQISIADDGVLAILVELLKIMHEMAGPDQYPAWEGPWLSIQGFKMLFILWRMLRLSIAELQNQSATANYYPTHFQPPKMVVEGVLNALKRYERPSSNLPEGPDTEQDLEMLETRYVSWMHSLCSRRDVWDVGKSVTRVLEEISGMDTDPVSLTR